MSVPNPVVRGRLALPTPVAPEEVIGPERTEQARIGARPEQLHYQLH